MLFNCAHPHNRNLTPDFVENGSKLHFLAWSDKLGDLPKEWHHTVFYDPPNLNAKIVHFTAGVPVFPEVRECEYTDAYMACAAGCVSSQPWKTLMGNSVHVGKVAQFQKERAEGHAAQKLPTSASTANKA